jgi:hypothetical protein
VGSFNELVRAIAKAEGLDEISVAGIGRNLRDAGLISKAGRGTSAARMTSTDAAHILIGVNGAKKAKHAPLAVNAFAKLHLSQDALADSDDTSEPESYFLRISGRPYTTSRKDLRFKTYPFGIFLEKLVETFIPDSSGTTAFERELFGYLHFELEFSRPAITAVFKTITTAAGDRRSRQIANRRNRAVEARLAAGYRLTDADFARTDEEKILWMREWTFSRSPRAKLLDRERADREAEAAGDQFVTTGITSKTFLAIGKALAE